MNLVSALEKGLAIGALSKRNEARKSELFIGPLYRLWPGDWLFCGRTFFARSCLVSFAAAARRHCF